MKFSVIIPVCNVAQYLREGLDSIVAQSYQDWECICVDDGSTDESGAILDEYAARYRRFKVVHQTNAGVSAARNRALELARGDFITFLDSDDRFEPDFIELAMRDLVADPELDLWVGQVATTDERDVAGAGVMTDVELAAETPVNTSAPVSA